MKWLALLAILLMPSSAFAASVTVDIYGTNVSNAQSNITKTGNNSYQVVQWATGDYTKSLKADINGNASDDITFTIHNMTAYRVVEVRVNNSGYNSYQANATGAISFTRTQTVRNQTYVFIPAVNAGYNQTWAWFWTYPSLFGLNFTNYFLPYAGATADLNMNGRNITNVSTMNITTTNVTVLNATDIKGNGSGIYGLNASNITIGSLSLSLFSLRTVVNITLNYTIGTSNTTGTMFTCYADSGTLNLTLPVGVVGTEFTVKKKDSSSNTCEIYSSQNIDGALRANISVQYNSIDLVYTDEWSII